MEPGPRVLQRKRRRYTAKEVSEFIYYSDSDENGFDIDYPSDELSLSDCDESVREVDEEEQNSDRSESEVDDTGDARATPPSSPKRQRGTGRARPAQNVLQQGWNLNYTPIDTTFAPGSPNPGPSLPPQFDGTQTPLEYFSLLFTDDMWELLCNETNRRAAQDKEVNADGYYCKTFKPVTIPEIKFRKDNPVVPKKDVPHKLTKTTFWCGYCRRYLCIRKGSTCYQDWHNKQEYWR
ncbi:hypothetical protein BsWGS_23715 [Bradybaena similaris]